MSRILTVSMGIWLWLLLAGRLAIAEEAMTTQPLSVTATPDSGTSNTVVFSVINNLGTTVTLNLSELPWMQPNGVATVMRMNGEKLRRANYIDDPVAGQVEIPPHGIQSHKKTLAVDFPDIGQLRKREDLVFFWYAELHPNEINDAVPVGGFVRLQQYRKIKNK